MPHQSFNVESVAAYLHLSVEDVERLVKDQEIPFERRGGRIAFRKREIDAWASQRILGLKDRPLAEYHQQTSQATRAFLSTEAMMPELVRPEFIDPAMRSKTKASVLRDLVELAGKTGRLNSPEDLLASLEAREELCPTACPGGVAFPHPRFHEEFMFESSFIVVGRPIQPIHFGAPDGHPTTLFFLICCQDDRLHLHTLARLCLMAVKTDLLERLEEAVDAPALLECLVTSEQAVLGLKKP